MVLLHATSRYDFFHIYLSCFRMAVFFVVAGMFFKVKDKTVKDILSRGMKQLIIPYFAFSILAFSICWVSPYLHPELYYNINSFGGIFKAAFFGMFLMVDKVTPNSFLPLEPLWFLICLFWCRLFGFMMLKDFKRKWTIRTITLVAIALIQIFNIEIFSLKCLITSLPFFLIGAYFKPLFISMIKMRHAYRILLGIVCIIVILMEPESTFRFARGEITGNLVIAFIRGIAGILATFVLASYSAMLPSRISNFISLIGSATLVVLAVHFYFLIPGKVLYSILGFDASQMHILYASVLSIICLCCSPAIFSFLKRKAPFIIGK